MVRVRIDFDNTYPIDEITEDYRNAEFTTELNDTTETKLLIEIDETSHQLLPNVYNLAFGPPGEDGEINDSIQLSHKDHSKVFSTILFTAFNYLNDHPDHYLGIDGSSNSRARLYWSFLQVNYDVLDKYFEIFGLKYYVRISRFGKTQYENPFDFNDIYPQLVRIGKGQKKPEFMYNYFIFRLKPGIPAVE